MCLKCLNYLNINAHDCLPQNTLSVHHISNTFITLSFTPFYPQNSLNSSGACVPRRYWPMLTPILPTDWSCWLDVHWVVDHCSYTRETVEHEKASGVAVLDTFKLVRLAPTSILLHPDIFVLAHSPSEWHTYTIHFSIVSRLKNPSLTCPRPFLHTNRSGSNK